MMETPLAPIVISGVGKRIGLALANFFLQQGQPVVGTFRNDRPELFQLRQRGARLFKVDLTDQNSIRRFLSTLLIEYTSIRAVIHNASDWLPDSNSLNQQQTFERMIKIHAEAPYQINMALSELLENHQNVADIIHITDYIVETGSSKHIAYSASKAALQNMTLSFAQLLAPKVKVNAIAPSLILFNPDDSEEYRRKTLDKSLLKKEPGVKEVVAAVDYVLTSEYMTGRTLKLDGGRHIRH